MCARKEEEPCTLCVFERYLEREREREYNVVLHSSVCLNGCVKERDRVIESHY